MKRFFGFCLILVFLVMIFPATGVSALSGKCGDNLTWVIDEEGVLTISGNGKMNSAFPEESSFGNPGWGRDITAVIIKNGVTSVEGSAFSGCLKLKTVKMADSVKEIGTFAFNNCQSLENIEFSKNLELIGPYAFSSCKALTEIRLYDKLEIISDNAFWGCGKLSEIILPDKGIRVGHHAFSETLYRNDSKNWTDDGLLYIGSCLIEANTGTRKNIKIKPGTKSIADWTFNNGLEGGALVSAELPDSLEIIGDCAFWFCKNLEAVNLPANLKEIGGKAFSSTAVTEIVLPEGITEIKGFGYCSKLKRVVTDDNTTVIGDGAFEGCTSLEELKLSDRLERIGETAFSGCTSIKEISLPDTVSEIGSGAFAECESLESIEIPEGVTVINRGMFQGCKNLKSVKLHDGITEIGSGAFFSCRELKSIDVPEKVTVISSEAFESSGLETVKLPDGITQIDKEAFYECTALKNINIPSKLQEIGDKAFDNCRLLNGITIPEGVKRIGISAFGGCEGLKDISVSEKNPFFTVDSGIIYNKDKTRIIQYLASNESEEFEIPARMHVNTGAFSGCRNLKSVALGSGTDVITEGMFRDAYGPERIEIPETVTKIEEGAFQNCTNLKEISLPAGITVIGDSAFGMCTGLESVYYSGTEAGFASVLVGTGNDLLLKKISFMTGEASGSVIKVYVNDEEVLFDTDPMIVNGRVLVPLRAVAEMLGAEVSWNGDTRMVTLEKRYTDVDFRIGSSLMWIGTKIVRVDTPAMIANSRTVVSIRAIAEAFGCDVQWHADEKAVRILG